MLLLAVYPEVDTASVNFARAISGADVSGVLPPLGSTISARFLWAPGS